MTYELAGFCLALVPASKLLATPVLTLAPRAPVDPLALLSRPGLGPP